MSDRVNSLPEGDIWQMFVDTEWNQAKDALDEPVTGVVRCFCGQGIVVFSAHKRYHTGTPCSLMLARPITNMRSEND